jgi:hypothetical protein
MARRRKKSKATSAAKSREKDSSPMVTEKSLPALPPSAIPPNAFSNDRVDPDSDTPTELSPRPRATHRHNESSSRGSSKPARSPERSDSNTKTEGLSLPATTYRKNRNSSIYQSPDSGPGDGPESFFIPVALDPSPVPSGTPKSASDYANEGARRKERDYFSGSKGSASDRRDDSQASTPHIAFQEKGRQPSSDLDVGRLKSGKFTKSPEQDQRKASVSGDEFKLQDAPVTKKGLSTRSNSSHSSVPHDSNSGKSSNGVVRKDGHSNLPDARRANESRTSEDTDGTRSSIRPAESNKAIPRKELPSSASKTGMC